MDLELLNKATFATLKPGNIDKGQAVSLARTFHLSPPGFESLCFRKKNEENFAHAQGGPLFNKLGRSAGPGMKTSARSPAVREDTAQVTAVTPLSLPPG